jgi:hypothetical protein|tara:strand:- start:478 stop:1164 length:687 start_codon:yes stop_codon:yes gene_type:complete
MGKSQIKVVRTLAPAAKKRFESIGADDAVIKAFIAGQDSYEVGVWESQILRPIEGEPFRKSNVVMVHPALYKKNDESGIPVDIAPFCMESGRRGAVQTVLNYGKEVAWCILDVDLNERALYEAREIHAKRQTFRTLAYGLSKEKVAGIKKMMTGDLPGWMDASDVFDAVDLTPKKKKKLDPVLPAPEPKEEPKEEAEQVEAEAATDEEVVEGLVAAEEEEDEDEVIVS